ncbi:UDP-4-amino-4,6-dideoxy-N-acetyl-beta-L-altrosamine transaminase [Leptospira perolatii]|uniref:UDP-4-amino-4, 6-dideoxy-N-acetyl-beta-L-altrosamine transaminase n=1 Tax=Leptospira perolatii TaxID=2023191 RepID=A0A2M9ZLV4_9LEPT|nr:DegT/DnrJ/EryC1/StrS family aminotransferase [Leptospira perolatii]PJZ69723.1 UDP-4-amino-4,6-dideoxy-N-acetyl-beta-L-altrosamine transaminase [Leptospira perolatii]PJZ73062.1 UDP-4-amino-4,6-dideoxy-N-acetyl-beta-L-altrosamine transaminase [Leptospira perolatii]
MITARKTFLPFALPLISEKAIEEVVSVLRSGWITSGPKVKEFEQEFAAYTGAKYAIALNSATAGLHLALESIGLCSEDAVFVPAVTFTATAEVVCYFGAEPILTDVDPTSNLMTAETLRSAIQRECVYAKGNLIHKLTGKTVRAFTPVHLAGAMCDMDSLNEIAKEFHLYVIEDSAHAFPATLNGKKVGTHGDFTVFSFYATKGITTGEGGMVTTKHSHFAERMRLMRLHGVNRETYDRPGWYYEVVSPGFKYNMTDIAAAIGIVQLSEAEELWKRRKWIAERYLAEFSDLPFLHLPSPMKNGEHSWHLFRVEVDRVTDKIDRDILCAELKKRNIGTSLHFIPLYEHPFYQRFGMDKKNFPNSNAMYRRTLSLPLFPGMSDSDVDDVIAAVSDIFENL